MSRSAIKLLGLVGLLAVGCTRSASEPAAVFDEVEAPEELAAAPPPAAAPTSAAPMSGESSAKGSRPKPKAKKSRRSRKRPGAPMSNEQQIQSLDRASSRPVAASTGRRAPEAEPEPVASSSFTHPGVGPFTLTQDDALSTFSIDVDTASYAFARQALQSGRLPDPASVRVEEFINAFDYDHSYTAPDGDDPFAVHLAAMPDPLRPGHHTVRVGIQAAEVDSTDRTPVHLTFLVDVSGSMSSPSKLPLAVSALHTLVEGLGPQDTVALATYAGRTAKILDPTSARNSQAIHDALDQLQSGGGTAMSSGVDLAYNLAAESFQPGHENRVIVLSDGDANIGPTSFDAILSQIRGHADRGITLSTIGLGTGHYRGTLMEQLANKGDGNHYYIDSPTEANRVFGEGLLGTLLTVARDTKVQVAFHPEAVRAYRLVGYENRDLADRDFRNDRVDAGEVGAGHDVTALYEVVLADGVSAASAGDLATVRLRWEAPGADTGVAKERAYALPAAALVDSVAQAPADARVAYVAGTFAEVLRGSPHAEEVSLTDLIALAQDAVAEGTVDADVGELIGLMQTAHRLGAGVQAVSAR